MSLFLFFFRSFSMGYFNLRNLNEKLFRNAVDSAQLILTTTLLFDSSNRSFMSLHGDPKQIPNQVWNDYV